MLLIHSYVSTSFELFSGLMLFAQYKPAIFQPPSVDGEYFGKCTGLLITD